MKVVIKAVASAAAFSLLVAAPATTATPKERARFATRFVVNNQAADGSFSGSLGFTADAVISLVAARRAPRAIEDGLSYLEENVSQIADVGEVAKVALAAIAGGRDARSFGGRDLVQEILDAEQQDGQYGPHTADNPNDGEVTNHTLAILALAAAAEVDPSTNALTWLLNTQCPDGGWQHTGPRTEGENNHCYSGEPESDFFKSDTNVTSHAVMAVAAHPNAAPYPVDPIKFFRAIRDDRKGGWGYTWGFRLTDANSTALAIQAYQALGRRLPRGAMRALKRLQYGFCGENAGAFAFTYEERNGRLRKTEPNLIATIGSISGLLRKPFPISSTSVTKSAPRAPAC